MENKFLKTAGNIHLSYFLEAAEILGIEYEMVIPRLTAKFSHNEKHWYINNTVTPLTNAPSSKLAKTKNFANLILAKHSVPVPIQSSILNEIDALKFFDKYKDIVFKPSQNIGGKGVSVLPKTEEDVLKAYLFAKENDKHGKVLAEEYIYGDNYRVMVVGDKVISVVKRIPAHVYGDGQSNITQLIELDNSKRKLKGLLPIVIDTELIHQVNVQGYEMESVPENGKYIQLRMNANMTTGGTTQEVSEEVDQYYKDICIDAVKALDLEYAGVDLITPDITKKSRCAINEVNYNPGIRLHYKVDVGTPKKVAVDIMKYISEKYSK